MPEDMNLATRTKVSPHDDLVYKASRFGAAGWCLAGILLLILIVENLYLALAPKPVLATQDGVVVGQVVFDETRVRSDDQILADLKVWTAKCTSANKLSIYEDLSVCLNHMAPDLANARLSEYEDTQYVVKIEKFGCQNTDVRFHDQAINLQREPLDHLAEAVISGEVICKDPGQKPASQSFKFGLIAELVPRTSNKPLAINVIEQWDVIE